MVVCVGKPFKRVVVLIMFYKVRKSNNLSIKEISIILRVESHLYIKIENKLIEPDIAFIKRFCKAFNVSSNYVLGLSNNYVITNEKTLANKKIEH
jgi:transcriptional regulator with XRE-family HTH domain